MSLKKVAARMHQEAKKRGISRRVLSRGLALNLWYRDDDIVLGMRRRGVKPSEKEVEICASTFFFSQPVEQRMEAGDTVWRGRPRTAHGTAMGFLKRLFMESRRMAHLSAVCTEILKISGGRDEAISLLY